VSVYWRVAPSPELDAAYCAGCIAEKVVALTKQLGHPSLSQQKSPPITAGLVNRVVVVWYQRRRRQQNTLAMPSSDNRKVEGSGTQVDSKMANVCPSPKAL
jgi:hypothetical protein